MESVKFNHLIDRVNSVNDEDHIQNNGGPTHAPAVTLMSTQFAVRPI